MNCTVTIGNSMKDPIWLTAVATGAKAVIGVHLSHQEGGSPVINEGEGWQFKVKMPVPTTSPKEAAKYLEIKPFGFTLPVKVEYYLSKDGSAVMIDLSYSIESLN